MNCIDQILKQEQIVSVRKKSHEELFAFFVKTDGDKEVIIGSDRLSIGTSTRCSLEDIVFHKTINKCKELNASGIILLHNHPKNIFNILLKPSEEDLDFTVAFYCMAKGHKVKLLDHLIVDSGARYYSFKENDLI